MIPALTQTNARRLMEEEGIGYGLTARPARDDAQAATGASKNEVAIESLELSHEKLATRAQGIIAILIG